MSYSSSRPYKYAYQTTEAERLERKRIHDLELAKLKARQDGKPAGQPPFGIALGQLFGGGPSRPYKQKTDGAKTPAERVAACKSRVAAHITRINAHTNIPAEQKTAIITRLNAKLVACSTPHGLDKEEKDKGHSDADPHGYGRLVRQVTPGALRKNPNPIQALIDAIWAFFGGRQNIPEPVEDFMAKYPKPATTTT